MGVTRRDRCAGCGKRFDEGRGTICASCLAKIDGRSADRRAALADSETQVEKARRPCSEGTSKVCLACKGPSRLRARNAKAKRRSVWTISGGGFESNRRCH